MSLRVVHIASEQPKSEAQLFWETELEPKMRAKMKQDAIRRFAKIGIEVSEEFLNQSNNSPAATESA